MKTALKSSFSTVKLIFIAFNFSQGDGGFALIAGGSAGKFPFY